MTLDGRSYATGNGQAHGTGRAIVLHPDRKNRHAAARTPESRLAEAVGLAEAIALDVRHAESVPVGHPRPAMLFGQGAVKRLASVVAESSADLVVVDHDLSPVQQRNLEQAWRCKVIDRTGLILEIFGARARTKEGNLQVELAALSYQRSRLVRSWTHLERQRGGFGFLGGPGESQLEIDRRIITDRITRLKRELGKVRRTRGLHRTARQRVPYPVVTLVGYTNAGKSTLFNKLTGDRQLAHDMLFATLDPAMRLVTLSDGAEVILSDTVGFISDLPTDLVAAFHATLEEVVAADVIVHVRDIAHPESEAQRRDVEAVLRDLGLEDRLEGDMIQVLNKTDLLNEEARDAVRERAARNADTVACSALTGEGMDALLATIDAHLARGQKLVELSIGHHDGAAIAWLYDHGRVLRRQDMDGEVRLLVRLDEAALARFARRYQAWHPVEPVGGST